MARSHPGIERVFFTNSGAEAIESAIKFARAATKRTRILYCDHAFHGLTTGALALNGGREFRSGFGPLLPGCDMIPFGDAAALARELRRGDVAAFIVEPIQGKGVNLAPDEFWQEAQSLCRRHKALMVIDEVQAGPRPVRDLLLPRAVRDHARHHHRLQGALGRLRARGGDALLGGGLRQRVQLHGPGGRPLLDVQHEPAGDGGRPGHPAGLRRRGHPRPGPQRPARPSPRRSSRWSSGTSSCTRCAGKGLMIGLVFGEPTSPGLRRRFRMIEALRPALFSQMIVVPLFHRHRILTQVAADNMNVVKLLPPLIAGDDEVELFVDALDDVLGQRASRARA